MNKKGQSQFCRLVIRGRANSGCSVKTRVDGKRGLDETTVPLLFLLASMAEKDATSAEHLLQTPWTLYFDKKMATKSGDLVRQAAAHQVLVADSTNSPGSISRDLTAKIRSEPGQVGRRQLGGKFLAVRQPCTARSQSVHLALSDCTATVLHLLWSRA